MNIDILKVCLFYCPIVQLHIIIKTYASPFMNHLYSKTNVVHTYCHNFHVCRCRTSLKVDKCVCKCNKKQFDIQEHGLFSPSLFIYPV